MNIKTKYYLVSRNPKRESQYPTCTILELKDQEIGEIYKAQERRTIDLEA